MKKTLSRVAPFLMAVVMLGSFAGVASAQTYIHANGGGYWTQTGSGWNSISNDGYCVSGRGPCGSNLWYLQYNYNHSGCGYDADARYDMASVVNYNGDTYAWIDSSTGNMYGADYDVVYNYASTYGSTVDQSAYYEAWATIALDKYRTSIVWESDGWGNAYICNGVSGLQVEFDEVKLEI
jgi:hypothetical protein